MHLGIVFSRLVERHRHQLAVKFEDQSLTYTELNKRVNQLANALRSYGIKEGDRVAILLHNSNQYLESFWAIAKLGAIMVPLNWRLNPKEIHYIIENSESKLLIYGSEFKETVEKAAVQLDTLENFIRVEGSDGPGIEYEVLISRQSMKEPVMPKIDLEDVFIIMYTSGTTGLPKGVMLTHNNIFWTSLNQIDGYPPHSLDRTLIVTPMFHVSGLLMFSLPAIHNGSSMVILRKFDVEQILKTMAEEEITSMFCAPTMFHMIAENELLVKKYNPKSLQFLLSGGAVLPMPVLEKMQRLFPNAKFTEGYGLTESASCTSMLAPEFMSTKRGSVGKPFLYNEMRVVDNYGNDVPIGQVGEVVQAGPTVMKGYWGNPKATEKAFWGRWLRTGDMGRYDNEGFLYIIDRKKDMIISGGENIYPKEIETVLYKHEKISEVAVFGIPDETWGESVMAVLVMKPGFEMNEQEVIDYCKEHLASYKKPKYVKILDELPKNPSGKILKQELKKQFLMVTGGQQ